MTIRQGFMGLFDELPSYACLDKNYPKGDYYEVLAELFGVEVGRRMGNSCTARISAALNACDARIPAPSTEDCGILIMRLAWDEGSKKYHQRVYINKDVLHVLPCQIMSRGYCAVRVAEMENYLRHRFGPPTHKISTDPY